MPTTTTPVQPFSGRDWQDMLATVLNLEDDVTYEHFDDLLRYVDMCDPSPISPVRARVGLH